jgi:hypothetical protein
LIACERGRFYTLVKPDIGKHIPGRPGDESLSPREIEARITRLTAVAINLFNRGSFEPAFETLMKAYLLDPSSPHVIECEKTLMPAWELMRKRGTFSKVDDQSGNSENLQLAKVLIQQMERLAKTEAGSPMNRSDDKNSPTTDPAKILQQQRIEALKRQHEEAKKRRESQMWRDASNPPKIMPKAEEKQQKHGAEQELRESQKISGGLLSKLKQGKFLG